MQDRWIGLELRLENANERDGKSKALRKEGRVVSLRRAQTEWQGVYRGV